MLDDGVIDLHKLRWEICLQNKEAILVHQNCKGLVKESVLCLRQRIKQSTMFRDILVWEMVFNSDGHKFVLEPKLKSSKNDLLLGMNLLQNR